MRPKMVFETEAKAMRHIQFNADDYKGSTVPIRAYYCTGCGGWHLTHKGKHNKK